MIGQIIVLTILITILHIFKMYVCNNGVIISLLDCILLCRSILPKSQYDYYSFHAYCLSGIF